MSPPGAESTAWTETVLVTFYGLSDGATFPGASLTLDKHGNLYGTTLVGGNGNCNNYEEWAFPSCGTVFQLSPPNGLNSWTYTPIYTFSGTTDGAYPGYFSATANLAVDTKGNLTVRPHRPATRRIANSSRAFPTPDAARFGS